MYDTNDIAAALEKLTNEQLCALVANPETGSSPAPPTIAKWRKDASHIPLYALLKIMPDSAPIKDTDIKGQTPIDPGFADYNPAWSKLPEWDKPKMIVAMPTTGHGTKTKTIFCLMALQARHGKKIAFLPCENNPIGRARNIIATQFLAHPGKPDWLLFIDNDMLVPFGSEEWAKMIWAKAGGAGFIASDMDICSRLVSHNKPLIGGLYVGKGAANYGLFSEAYSNLSINRNIHAAPVNKIIPCSWVATGAMLINRSVFVEIAKSHPELCPRHADDVFRFFAMEDDEGEDMLFCKRAREAGIQPFVDLGCHCGHIGDYTYWPHNTIAAQPKAGEFLDARTILAALGVHSATVPVQMKNPVKAAPKATPVPSANLPQVKISPTADISSEAGDMPVDESESDLASAIGEVLKV